MLFLARHLVGFQKLWVWKGSPSEKGCHVMARCIMSMRECWEREMERAKRGKPWKKRGEKTVRNWMTGDEQTFLSHRKNCYLSFIPWWLSEYNLFDFHQSNVHLVHFNLSLQFLSNKGPISNPVKRPPSHYCFLFCHISTQEIPLSFVLEKRKKRQK